MDAVLAMSFPADGVESTYRNSIHEVSAMLNYRHFNHFMIFNLSERVYDYSILNGLVCNSSLTPSSKIISYRCWIGVDFLTTTHPRLHSCAR